MPCPYLKFLNSYSLLSRRTQFALSILSCEIIQRHLLDICTVTGCAKRLIMVFAGAHIASRDAHGHTPLHLAASRGYGSLCDLLIGRGANAHAISEDKSTPAMLAIARGFPELGAKLAAVADDDVKSKG